MKKINVPTKTIASALALSAGMLFSLQASAASCYMSLQTGKQATCTTSGIFISARSQKVSMTAVTHGGFGSVSLGPGNLKFFKDNVNGRDYVMLSIPFSQSYSISSVSGYTPGTYKLSVTSLSGVKSKSIAQGALWLVP